MDDTAAPESPTPAEPAAAAAPGDAAGPADPVEVPDTHLSKELLALLHGLEGKDITIGGLLDHIGDRGFGLLLLVLALPAALPIPAPGYATPFGVLMVIALEMGLISPPVGINVFVVKGIADGVPLNTIFRGIWPFWFAMLLAVILVLMVPDIALLLPDTMFG